VDIFVSNMWNDDPKLNLKNSILIGIRKIALGRI